MSYLRSKYFAFCLVALLLAAGGLMGSQRQQLRHDRMTFNYGVKVAKVKDEKSFVIVICSYNNQEYVEKNLSSALSQVYSNFRVIFIDDMSTDDNFRLAQECVKKYKAQDKVTLIRNHTNLGAMANTVRAVHMCRNDEIVVMLDGDDFLNGPHVLKTLNQYYQNPDTWLTYGQCIESTTGNLGMSKPINHLTLKVRSIRRKAWMTSHLRTFYAGLFKKIKLEDFTYNGRFLEMAADVAAMMPMIEMAGLHSFYIDEPLCIYNLDNVANDHKKSAEKQEMLNQYVRRLTKYQPLKTAPWLDSYDQKKDVTDIIAFSMDRPLQIYAMLESLYRHGKNFGRVFIIYRASGEEYKEGYCKVMEQFPEVVFVEQDHVRAKEQFKSLVMKYAFDASVSPSKFITFSTDDLILREPIDFNLGVRALIDYQVTGFYYRLGNNIHHSYMTNKSTPPPYLSPLGNDIYFWRFVDAVDDSDWKYPHTVDLTTFKKSYVKRYFEKFHFTYPNDLEGEWAKILNLKRLGLCHSTSKVINVPLNVISNNFNRGMKNRELTPQELLKKFNQGLKIDLDPLQKIVPQAPHMEYHPTYVMRMDD